MKYRTIQDCAVDIICKEGNQLSNKQIAEKVRQIMNSKTSPACIAWYKSHIKSGDIPVNLDCRKNPNISNTEDFHISTDTQDDYLDNTKNIEESIIENEAENFVYQFEKQRTGKYPIKIKNSGKNAEGYDFDSGDRHIEVKGKKGKKTTWLQLTANETESLIKDSKYCLYLVEGDFKKNEDIDLYIIGRDDLLAMSQLKIHARLTQLSNLEKRKVWKTIINNGV